jgi:hypothetical protein
MAFLPESLLAYAAADDAYGLPGEGAVEQKCPSVQVCFAVRNLGVLTCATFPRFPQIASRVPTFSVLARVRTHGLSGDPAMNEAGKAESARTFVLSDGEVDFLWWFIQGSIMDPGVRVRLYAHWGLCSRHSLAFFVVEAAFRPHLIHGCTILYRELMRRAIRVLDDRGLHSLVPGSISRHLLHVAGPCHLCDLGYHERSEGNVSPDRLAQGRDMTNAVRFAVDNRRGWLPYVCSRCAGTDSPVLCRLHLIEAMEHEGAQIAKSQHASIVSISTHLSTFENAFRWDLRGTDTEEDRGALIGAIGWCSGWTELIRSLLPLDGKICRP